MAQGKRTKAQREQDLTVIARLRCKGLTLSEIEEELCRDRDYRLSRQTIHADMKEVLKRWRDQATEEIATQKAKELARLDTVERAAWREWQRSKQDRQRREEGDGPNGPSSKTVTEGRLADPRYLQVVQGCIDKRCALLGLNAPERREHTGKDGGPIETRGNVTLSEVLEEYNDEIDAATERLRASQSDSGSEDTAQDEKTA